MEHQQDNIKQCYLLSIPDEVLLYEIFPRLPRYIMFKLSHLHSRFNNICNNDIVWQMKVTHEYHDISRFKHTDITWKDYYKSLLTAPKIPVYYNGDIISYFDLFLDTKYIKADCVVPLLKSSINAMKLPLGTMISPDMINIVFTDNGSTSCCTYQFCLEFNPIIVVKYPIMTVDVKSMDFSDIRKILLFASDNFNEERSHMSDFDDRTSSVIEFTRVTSFFRFADCKYMMFNIGPRDCDILFGQLTSSLNNLPIYGAIGNNEEFVILFHVTVCKQTIFTKHARVPGGESFRLFTIKFFNKFAVSEIIDLLLILKANSTDIEYVLPTNKGIENSSQTTDAKGCVSYKNSLRSILYNELKRIGHIINESPGLEE